MQLQEEFYAKMIINREKTKYDTELGILHTFKWSQDRIKNDARQNRLLFCGK